MSVIFEKIDLLNFSKKLNVLYVEDERILRKITLTLLEQVFHFIDVAVDGNQAVRLFNEKEYDIVIMDLELPNLHGLDATEQIKKKNPEVKIIVVSHKDDPTTFTKTIELGVDGYLLKPIKKEQFFKTLEKTICKIEMKFSLEKEQKENEEKRKILTHQSKLMAMGEMLSMIAHQWRQPLNSISVMAINLLTRKELGTLDEETLLKNLNQTIDTTTYLSDTIEDFQSFFKPDKKAENILVRKVINDGLKLLKYAFEDEEIQVIQDYQCTSFVKVFKNEFVQALLNILNNAKDAFLENNIQNRQIKISSTEDNSSIEICIEDNGGGIHPKSLEKIFNPYFSTKGKHGTGLGLYMSKTIIEGHNKGILKVANTLNGAKFIITLPKNI
ncbi:MAG: response regulator [Campylobacterales bacterium]|nr:response regulator [Campylobacterales bacterium]